MCSLDGPLLLTSMALNMSAMIKRAVHACKRQIQEYRDEVQGVGNRAIFLRL